MGDKADEIATALLSHARLLAVPHKTLRAQVAAAIRDAVAEEREACAREFDAELALIQSLPPVDSGLLDGLRRAVGVIRARGKATP